MTADRSLRSDVRNLRVHSSQLRSRWLYEEIGFKSVQGGCLQTQPNSRPRPPGRCPVATPLFLRGLTDDEALALWRGFIGGERSGRSSCCCPFGRLAITHYCCAPWPARWPSTNRLPPTSSAGAWPTLSLMPPGLPLKSARTHVLHFALRGWAKRPGACWTPPGGFPHAEHLGGAGGAVRRRPCAKRFSFFSKLRASNTLVLVFTYFGANIHFFVALCG
jgi:hypothetical protein